MGVAAAGHTLFQILTHDRIPAGEHGSNAGAFRTRAHPWRCSMGTGMPFLEISLGVTVVVAIIWWMASLTLKPRAQHRREPARAHIPRQPWDNDKAGGRGNR